MKCPTYVRIYRSQSNRIFMSICSLFIINVWFCIQSLILIWRPSQYLLNVLDEFAFTVMSISKAKINITIGFVERWILLQGKRCFYKKAKHVWCQSDVYIQHLETMFWVRSLHTHTHTHSQLTYKSRWLLFGPIKTYCLMRCH